MAFAQLTYRESLRDIEACLRSLQGKLYHLGFRGKVARSTLADANESRDWRIFADFAHKLIATARELYVREPLGVDLEQSLYALDSTTIDLCLALFPWARFRRRKAAVKMHTLLDLRGNIPTFIRVTDGQVHDVNLLDEIMPEAGAFYVMDRGYIDFARLFVLTLSSAFFVVRTKSNVLLQRRYSHPVDKRTGVRSDQTVLLSSYESASVYPDSLRRVSYFDADTGKRLKFLTNNFTLPALTIVLWGDCESSGDAAPGNRVRPRHTPFRNDASVGWAYLVPMPGSDSRSPRLSSADPGDVRAWKAGAGRSRVWRRATSLRSQLGRKTAGTCIAEGFQAMPRPIQCRSFPAWKHL